MASATGREAKTEAAGEEDTETKANFGVFSDVPYVYDMKEGESGEGSAGLGKGTKARQTPTDESVRECGRDCAHLCTP